MTYAVDLNGALLEVPDQHGLPAFSWRGVCRVPGCRKAADEAHHIVPRGRTGGPLRYIVLDGQVVANLAGICAFHHLRITTGEAWIIWQDARWHYKSPQRAHPEPLLPLANEGAVRAAGPRYCPHCGQSKQRRDPYQHTGPPRQRKAYTIRVPDDGEDGAEVADVLLEQIGEMIGLQDPHTASAKYYALVACAQAVIIDPRSLAPLKNGAP